jgi:hypothetical protein
LRSIFKASIPSTQTRNTRNAGNEEEPDRHRPDVPEALQARLTGDKRSLPLFFTRFVNSIDVNVRYAKKNDQLPAFAQ